MAPEIKYATTTDGVSIGYCALGRGAPLVVMPGDAEHNVGAGRHEFQTPLIDASDGIPILRELSEAS